MKTFYKINIDKTAILGSGLVIPSGFSEYIEGSEPQELLDALLIMDEAKQILDNNNKALEYLASTDWYITRLMETSVAVPAEILTARAEARASIV